MGLKLVLLQWRLHTMKLLSTISEGIAEKNDNVRRAIRNTMKQQWMNIIHFLL
jgi:hypothetical protein